MVHYISGINIDRIEINGKSFASGYDFAWDYNDTKPFIGDILQELCGEAWYEEPWTGYNVFAGEEMSQDILNYAKNDIREKIERKKSHEI